MHPHGLHLIPCVKIPLLTIFFTFCTFLLLWNLMYWERAGLLGRGNRVSTSTHFIDVAASSSTTQQLTPETSMTSTVASSTSSPSSQSLISNTPAVGKGCGDYLKSVRTPYPPRLNMGPCPKTFGEVAVFVVARAAEYNR